MCLSFQSLIMNSVQYPLKVGIKLMSWGSKWQFVLGNYSAWKKKCAWEMVRVNFRSAQNKRATWYTRHVLNGASDISGRYKLDCSFKLQFFFVFFSYLFRFNEFAIFQTRTQSICGKVYFSSRNRNTIGILNLISLTHWYNDWRRRLIHRSRLSKRYSLIPNPLDFPFWTSRQ